MNRIQLTPCISLCFCCLPCSVALCAVEEAIEDLMHEGGHGGGPEVLLGGSDAEMMMEGDSDDDDDDDEFDSEDHDGERASKQALKQGWVWDRRGWRRMGD